MKNNVSLLFAILTLITLASSKCDVQNPHTQGAFLYKGYCGNCHMENGKGLKGLYPPLAQSDFLKNNQNKLTCIINMGISGPIVVNGKTYDHAMAGNPSLNDVEITNIINYINNAWGNEFGEISITDVKKQLSKCKKSSD